MSGLAQVPDQLFPKLVERQRLASAVVVLPVSGSQLAVADVQDVDDAAQAQTLIVTDQRVLRGEGENHLVPVLDSGDELLGIEAQDLFLVAYL